jgi:hypothetical protein
MNEPVPVPASSSVPVAAEDSPASLPSNRAKPVS